MSAIIWLLMAWQQAHTMVCPTVPIRLTPGSKGVVVLYKQGEDCYLRVIPIEDVESIVIKPNSDCSVPGDCLVGDR